MQIRLKLFLGKLVKKKIPEKHVFGDFFFQFCLIRKMTQEFYENGGKDNPPVNYKFIDDAVSFGNP